MLERFAIALICGGCGAGGTASGPSGPPPQGAWSVVLEGPGVTENAALAMVGKDTVFVASMSMMDGETGKLVVRSGALATEVALQSTGLFIPQFFTRVGPGGQVVSVLVDTLASGATDFAGWADGSNAMAGLYDATKGLATIPPRGEGQGGMFFLATDPAGKVRWAHSFHESGVLISSMAALPDGGLVIAGQYTTAVAIDGAAATGLRAEAERGKANAFVGRLAADGALQWLRGTTGGSASGLVVDAATDGSIRLIGACEGDVRVRGTTAELPLRCPGPADAYAIGFTRDGEAQWATVLPGKVDFLNLRGAVHRDGGVVIAGGFSGDLGGEGFPKVAPAAPNDGFVARIDAAGKPVWLRHQRGPGPDFVRWVAADAGGGTWALAQLGDGAELDLGAGVKRVSEGMHVFHIDAAGAVRRTTRICGVVQIASFGAEVNEVSPYRIAVGDDDVVRIAGTVFGATKLTIGDAAIPFSGPASQMMGHGFVVGFPAGAVPAP